jgi:hypothetical protein
VLPDATVAITAGGDFQPTADSDGVAIAVVIFLGERSTA